MSNFKMRVWTVALAALFLLAACGDSTTEQNNAANNGGDVDNNPPLTSAEVLLDGAPKNDELGEVAKGDETFPPRYDDLVDVQSPVRDQGSRGVCSIFSTVGLMEHLYIKEGTIQNPDFSEQYLQWSAKNEVGRFANTSGSTARANLRAISNYGIPEESVWPYEPFPWDSSDDPDCEGDDKPTKCFTNGNPPAEAEDAELFNLPRGRYISTRTDDVKAHMQSEEQAVVVGLDFFYQSWSHGGSSIPVDKSMFREGYVPYPNETDKTESLENRAGHSILLVGWDDDAEVELIDAEGEPRTDENGDPVTEKGFFIFKNSWGTGGFGSDNELPDGYGYISYRYVEEYGSGRVSDEPVFETPDEICGDGEDNDGNGLTDCEDEACTDDPACQSTSNELSYENNDSAEIPDDDPDGVTSTIDVTEEGTVAKVSVTVDITHTYRGDLSAILTHPNGDVAVLFEADGSSEDDIRETFVVEDFNGNGTQGAWELNVWDEANFDTGTLESWTLDITTE